MNHRSRLWPLAIFLTVVAMVITTMALLTAATANADRAMAERFASVTQTRYQLEADADSFISEAANAHASGESYPAGGAVSLTGRGYEFYEELNGYSISVAITVPDGQGRYELLEWKVSKLWHSDDPSKDIWTGE